MKSLLHKKNITNVIGMKTANFLLGDYRPFVASCTDGTAQIIGLQMAWTVRNFTKVAQEVGYKPQKTIVTQTLQQGDTFSFRQMAIRAYNSGQGMVLGENDYYEQFMVKMYIRSKKGAVTFTPTAIPDTYGTVALDTDVDNPTLECAPPDYTYYPVMVAPMLIETQWKYGACKFYMTQNELDRISGGQIYLLASKDSEIKLHGGAKTIQAQYMDVNGDWHYPSTMRITDNELLQAIRVNKMRQPKELRMQNTPNIKNITMGYPYPELPQESAQSLADMIAASTITGEFVGVSGDYQYIINEVISDSATWTWREWE